MSKIKSPTTTVALTVADNERLTAYCGTYSIPKKEFIGIILNYLEVNGINPKLHHAPKTELEKIIKRIDQIFGFIKVQERTFLKPALSSVISTEDNLKKMISHLTTRDDLSGLATETRLDKVGQAVFNKCAMESKKLEVQLSDIENKIKLFQEKISNDLEAIKKKKFFN